MALILLCEEDIDPTEAFEHNGRKKEKTMKNFLETFWESCVETFRAFNSGNWNGGLRLLFLPCFVHWNYSIMLPSCIIFYSFEIFSEK